jgi:hypothetical protein
MIPAIPVLAIFLALFTPLATQVAYGADNKPAPAKPAASQGTSAQQDKAIEAAIRAKLAKSKIGNDGFTVRVQGGVAYWEGSTSVVQHKGSATRMAKSAGALKVVNNIKVSDDAKAKAAGNLEEGRRRAQVKRGDSRDEGRPASPTSANPAAAQPNTQPASKPISKATVKPSPSQGQPAGPQQAASQ